jgi:hypothetical protein
VRDRGISPAGQKEKNTSLKDSHVLVLQTKAITHDGTTMTRDGHVECIAVCPRQCPRLFRYYNGQDAVAVWGRSKVLRCWKFLSIEPQEPTFRYPFAVGWGCSGLVQYYSGDGCCCVDSTCRSAPGIEAQGRRSRYRQRLGRAGPVGQVTASPWQTCVGFHWRCWCLQTDCGLQTQEAQESVAGRMRSGEM